MLKWLGILWPAFLTAGMLEIVVFAFVDPANVPPAGTSFKVFFARKIGSGQLSPFASSVLSAIVVPAVAVGGLIEIRICRVFR